MELCLLCEEEITDEQRGLWMPVVYLGGVVVRRHAHVECMARSVLGGIGHHENHDYWCVKMGDPDGGRTYRESALLVFAAVKGAN